MRDRKSDKYFRSFARFLVSLFVVSSSYIIAHAEETLRIGAIFSVSGWGADAGIAELHGVLMAKDAINSSGGVNGKKIEIVAEDTRSELKDTVTAFHKLNSKNVKAILGPNWAEFTEVAGPLANSANIPLITSSGYKAGITTADDYIFTLWPPPSVAARPLGKLITSKHKRIAIFTSDNAYFDGIREAFEKFFAGTNVEMVVGERFPAGVFDYRSSISKLKRSPAEAILCLLLETGEFASFLKQAKELKLDLPIYAANTIPFDNIVKKSPNLAEGVIYFDYKASGGENFDTDYRRRFKQEPGFGSAKAYDSLFLLKEAMERCGESPNQIRECLKSTKLNGVSGAISFDKDGVIKESPDHTFLIQVRNGKFERYEGA